MAALPANLPCTLPDRHSCRVDWAGS